MNKPKILIDQTDITKLEIDAIVNAANKTLLGGGGVDGAIHLAAGKRLKTACRKLNGAETGEAKITPGFNLPAKYVIHAVGPYYTNGKRNDDALLESAYQNSLSLAASQQLESIAFPNISTGIYGFPKERAAEIAIKTVKNFLKSESSIKKVIFVTYSKKNHEIYTRLLG
ncbi:MAG: O-acetyl-ADP-ribose deacetylase [Bacteroidota bacterium]|nr:O-acetyl-ADP-ribose deacetylase [Bacteroidota bacterium]